MPIRLREGRYSNLSQVYWDIHLAFANVRDACHSRSTVLWRDAHKMDVSCLLCSG